MTRNDIAKVIERVPTLTPFGIGLSESQRGLTKGQREDKIAKAQKELLACADVCTKVCDWLGDIRITQAVNKHRSSYGIKHLAERAIGEYVSNGALIAAAIHSGFPFKLMSNSPNVRFGMSEKSLEREAARDNRPAS